MLLRSVAGALASRVARHIWPCENGLGMFEAPIGTEPGRRRVRGCRSCGASAAWRLVVEAR
jgi:hypothetical protein